ncbi:DUF1422 family protein, partial [Escherichia coli]|uniref:DUF1422 family protein n=1 Tax=Escherichia coli TaxID=562 RepID=UPI000E76AB87
MKQANQDRGTLLLALVAGLSINGTFAALFSSIVPFLYSRLFLVLTVILDGNQVWLITAGGALFAAWPMVYA